MNAEQQALMDVIVRYERLLGRIKSVILDGRTRRAITGASSGPRKSDHEIVSEIEGLLQ